MSKKKGEIVPKERDAKNDRFNGKISKSMQK